VDEVFIFGHTPWAKNAVNLPPLHIHERAKKGIVHGTQYDGIFPRFLSYAQIEINRLGEEVSRRPRNQCRNETIRKLVSFVFKYRPIGESYSFPLTHQLSPFFAAVLMADGVAPKQVNTSRKRKPLADPEDIIDLTLDGEVHARRKKEPKARKPIDAAVKTERSFTLDGDVIDLTT